MSSIAQLVSEIAHSVKQPDSIPVRKAIKLGIIHARNEVIRKSYKHHNVADKILQQRVKISLIDVPDGDLYGSEDLNLKRIKRSTNKVPRPVRLVDGLPFHSVRTSGTRHNIEIPFAKEAVSKYYWHLPGVCLKATYDYINEYVYLNVGESFNNLGAIIIEGVFEYPHIIETETVEGKLNIDDIDDNDEFLLPEDMIDDIKKIVLESWNINIIRDTNEVPSINIVK